MNSQGVVRIKQRLENFVNNLFNQCKPSTATTLAVLGLVIGFTSVLVTIYLPEIRQWLHSNNIVEAKVVKDPITFITPKDKERIDVGNGRIDVEFVVNRKIPKGYHIILIILDPVGNYWSYGTSPNNVYKVQLGDASTASEAKFTILALCTNENIPVGQVPAPSPGLFSTSISVIKK